MEKQPDNKFTPLRYIDEPIQPQFDAKPRWEKMPGCPARFVWRQQSHAIAELCNEWHDYQRRGRMARNMRPSHAAMASRRGSWGVGRDFFRVRTETGQIFELYYDRNPNGAGGRKGSWYLFQELEAL